MVEKKAQFLLQMEPAQKTMVDIPLGIGVGDMADEIFVDDMPECPECEGQDGEVLFIEEGDEDDEAVFLLTDIPGAPDADEIDDEAEEEEIRVSDEEADEWNWQKLGHGKFIEWLQGRFNNIPKHSGYDTTGLEKAIAYFEAMDREISKAMRADFKNEINHASAERAREQIESGLERLIDRLDRVKSKKFKRNRKTKKAWYAADEQIVKNAGTAKITGVTIVVPLLISRIARILINGHVSAGHDMNDMFMKLSKEYSLNKRERAEVDQLVRDMGFPINVDRGIVEEGDRTVDGFDVGPTYPN